MELGLYVELTLQLLRLYTYVLQLHGAFIGVLMSFVLDYRVSIILGFGVTTKVGTGLGVRGLSLIKVAVMGAVVVAVVGALLAHMGENELKEIWEKLHKCKRELFDCVCVVK